MQDIKNQLIDVIKLSEKQCKEKISCTLAYATSENFLGRIVAGYNPDATHISLVTRKVADALCQVQNQLNQKQLGLYVFDSYRPLRAVKDFKHWMHAPVQSEYELERKRLHYPHVEKSQFALLGYVADEVSNHCFADTIDLSIIDLKTNQLLNMGAIFDYFDEVSHATATAEMIGQEAYKNRQLLSDAMQTAGFLPYETEFWHFTFRDRDIHAPIDIEITKSLEGWGV